jgi:hypothetical protein
MLFSNKSLGSTGSQKSVRFSNAAPKLVNSAASVEWRKTRRSRSSAKSTEQFTHTKNLNHLEQQWSERDRDAEEKMALLGISCVVAEPANTAKKVYQVEEVLALVGSVLHGVERPFLLALVMRSPTRARTSSAWQTFLAVFAGSATTQLMPKSARFRDRLRLAESIRN